VIFLLSVIVFVMITALPGNAASAVVGLNANPADIKNVEHQLGMDLPPQVRYMNFLVKALHGDFGRSIVTQIPVTTLVGNAMLATLVLASASLLISLPIGLSLGVVGAVKKDSIWDTLATASAVTGLSMPAYLSGLLLIWLFSVRLGWLPTAGNQEPTSIVLPAVTLAATTMPVVARMTRSSVLEVLRQDYVRTARSKGLNPRVVLLRHVMRNAAIPIITVIGLQLGYLFSGAIIVETVFGWPGLGRLLVDSINNRDTPVVQGGILLIGTIFILINLSVDVIYAFANPRIRYD
jgi:ABC-type dipeptide/oligopeptide/nickel transport system permease component